jgi:pimeloyl-ACP methyl ester carboxylesterase
MRIVESTPPGRSDLALVDRGSCLTRVRIRASAAAFAIALAVSVGFCHAARAAPPSTNDSSAAAFIVPRNARDFPSAWYFLPTESTQWTLPLGLFDAPCVGSDPRAHMTAGRIGDTYGYGESTDAIQMDGALTRVLVDGQKGTGTVQVAQTPSQAIADVALFRSSSFLDCLSWIYRSRLEESQGPDATVDWSLQPLSSSALHLPDGAVAFTMRGTVDNGALVPHLEIIEHNAMIAVGRAEVNAAIMQVSTTAAAPPDDAVLSGLLHAMVDRAEKTTAADPSYVPTHASGECDDWRNASGPQGDPYEAIYRANHQAIQREIDWLQVWAPPGVTPVLPNLPPGPPPPRPSASDVVPLWKALERVTNSNVLLFDPRGDGRIATVVGDLSRARHVAVLVPGILNTLNSFTGEDGRVLDQEAATLADCGVATVDWLGYDTPGLFDAGANTGAHEGAPALKRLVDSIRERTQRQTIHVTVVGHSYGSFVLGKALSRYGLHVDDAVAIGSPGMGEGVTNICGLGSGFERLWTAKAAGDFVPSLPTHGSDPNTPGFGATRFDTGVLGGAWSWARFIDPITELWGGVEIHTSYYTKGSLAVKNIARIVAGRFDQVTVLGPRHYRESRRCAGGGGSW